MEINFQGQYQRGQYFKGVYRSNKPKTSIAILRIALFVVFAALFIAVIFSEVQNGLETSVFFRLGRHLLTFLALLYFILQPFIKSYQNASRLWKDPFIRAGVAGTVSGNGISYGSYIQEWHRFIKKDIGDEMVVLVTDDRIMSILPRNFFSTAQDWERFIQMVEQKVKEPK